MKAVVVEINNNLASILTDDGRIETKKNKNYEIGQVIAMRSIKGNMIKKLTVAAGSAAAFILFGVGTWAYASPYSYVSVDVNPSIEYTVNRFDRVLSVKAVNDDGQEILQDIALEDLENKTISDAIVRTVEQITEAGYFDSNTEGGIVIATSGEDLDKADELAQELKETVEQETTENGDAVKVETYSVGFERVQEAKELGVTPGKLNLVEKLQAAAGNPADFNKEEWLNKPVKDIMKATKEYRKMTEVSEETTDLEDQQQQLGDAADALVQTDTDIEEIEDADEVDDDASEAAEDKQEKEAKKTVKAAEKAKEKEDKAVEKAKEKSEKAAEKAKEKSEKAAEKAKKASEDASEQEKSDIDADQDYNSSNIEADEDSDKEYKDAEDSDEDNNDNDNEDNDNDDNNDNGKNSKDDNQD